MIPLLLFAAAAAAPAVPLDEVPGGDAKRFEACTALIKADPKTAVDQADAWARRSADVPAQQCLGLALVAVERWAPASVAFEQAAREAELRRDGRAATLWTQAGNAALAGDDPGRARDQMDRALALPTLPDPLRGEALIDRARADVALNDLATARKDLDSGLTLVPQDPFVWLLSATLARRQNDLARAEKEIQEALKLAPDDAAVALEAGNIASARGATEAARLAWQQAAKLAPDDPAGKAASAALAQTSQP